MLVAELEARVSVVVAEEEAERWARRSRRQLGHTPLDSRCSGCRLHRSSQSDLLMAQSIKLGSFFDFDKRLRARELSAQDANSRL